MIVLDPSIIKKIDKLNFLISKGIDFSRLGIKAVELIKDRTEAGKDVQGNSFASYSPDYLEFKQARGGRFFKGVVNLNNEGNMLAAIDSSSDRNSATIFFLDELNNDKAHGHNTGGGVNPKREFFGLSDDDEKVLAGLAIKDMNRFIDSL